MFILTVKGEPEWLQYLAWQKPVWDEVGYFYTSLDSVLSMLQDEVLDSKHPYVFDRNTYVVRVKNTGIYPFLFQSRADAKHFIKCRGWLPERYNITPVKGVNAA